jgi:hypothetical protein
MNLEVGSCAYNEVKKARFHREGGALLRKVAKLLRLKPEEYEIRWNAAGIAVSGDWTLHADDVYVQINLEIDWVLVRTCKGRKDYTGGTNRQYPFSLLHRDGAEGLAEFVKQVRATAVPDRKNSITGKVVLRDT